MGLIFKNPSSSAQNDLNQIPGTIKPYYQPFIDAGNQAMGQLQQQYGRLMNIGQPLQKGYGTMAMHPSSIIDKISSNFKMSPAENFNMSQDQDAISNAQASGGMSGTPQDQQEAGQLSQNLSSEDLDNYLKMALGIGHAGTRGSQDLYNRGLYGNQRLNQTGYQASNQLAEALTQVLTASAHNSYAGTENNDMHNEGLIGLGANAIKGVGKVLHI